MPLKDPEARKVYSREYQRRRKAEDPEYKDREAKRYAAIHARKYREDEKYKAKRSEDAKKWHEEKGRDRARAKYGYKPMEEHLAGLAAKRCNLATYMREWHKTEKGQRSCLAATLKRRGGFTVEQYDEAYLKQEGKCAICGIWAIQYGKGRLVVDHCHTSGRFRSLLCGKCNCAIGMLGEDVTVLNKAIKYLLEVCARDAPEE